METSLGQCLGFSLAILYLLFLLLTESLAEPDRPTGQCVPGIHLSLPPQAGIGISNFYQEAGDLSSVLHAYATGI